MKKIYILIGIILVSLICACNNNANTINGEKDNAIDVITTIFPIYDITKELVKGIEDVNVTLLMDEGIDLHNFNPSSKDLVDITNSDLFIYIGGESDEWVDEAFDTLKISKSKQLNLMKKINNLKEEELKEGMEDTEEEEEDEKGKKEYDEHIWLSIRKTREIAKLIKDSLRKKIKDIEKLNSNFEELDAKLNELDNKYSELIENAKNNNKLMTMIFADRFPFRYFVDDYGIDYYAAFKGCSAESEASFKTIVFLADKLKKLNIKYVFALDDSDQKIARTVIKTVGGNDIDILVLDSMQSKTLKDIEKNITYIDIMNDNLKVLSKYFE